MFPLITYVSVLQTFLLSGKQSPNLIIWNLTSGKQQHNLPTGFNNYPTSVAFSPDGHTLVSGSDNGAVEIWDPSNGQLLRTLV